jgi:hypothetical protein
MITTLKKPIAERALLNRINRVLAKQQQVIRTARADSVFGDRLGRYYVIDRACNSVQPVDIEKLATELGVLADYEELAR